MKKIFLWMLVPILAFSLTACTNAIIEPTVENTEELTTTELTVWGMTCNRCKNNIISAIVALEGVTMVYVDLKAEKVTVVHEPELDIDTIKRSITAEGYNIP